jgi:hypothetical protein
MERDVGFRLRILQSRIDALRGGAVPPGPLSSLDGVHFQVESPRLATRRVATPFGAMASSLGSSRRSTSWSRRICGSRYLKQLQAAAVGTSDDYAALLRAALFGRKWIADAIVGGYGEEGRHRGRACGLVRRGDRGGLLRRRATSDAENLKMRQPCWPRMGRVLMRARGPENRGPTHQRQLMGVRAPTPLCGSVKTAVMNGERPSHAAFLRDPQHGERLAAPSQREHVAQRDRMHDAVTVQEHLRLAHLAT